MSGYSDLASFSHEIQHYVIPYLELPFVCTLCQIITVFCNRAGVLWMPHIQKTLTMLQEGVSVNCMLSLFLEYRCKIAPVLNLERKDVSDRISEPVCLFQCFYRSVKVCHIVPFGKIYTPLRIVESIFTQDYSYLEISVVIWLAIILFKV